MSDPNLYNAARALAVLLTVASAMIAASVNLPDLGLSRQGVALLTVVQAGIAAANLVLPQVQKPPGNVRGDSRDDDSNTWERAASERERRQGASDPH